MKPLQKLHTEKETWKQKTGKETREAISYKTRQVFIHDILSILI